MPTTLEEDFSRFLRTGLARAGQSRGRRPRNEQEEEMSRTNAAVLAVLFSPDPVPKTRGGGPWGTRNLKVQDREGLPGRMLYSYDRLIALCFPGVVFLDAYADFHHVVALKEAAHRAGLESVSSALLSPTVEFSELRAHRLNEQGAPSTHQPFWSPPGTLPPSDDIVVEIRDIHEEL